LVIIHYHLLPGGVCSAIKNSVFALSQSGWFAHRTLRILTGRMDGVEEFVRFLDQWGIKGQVEVDARLDYGLTRTPSGTMLQLWQPGFSDKVGEPLYFGRITPLSAKIRW
jgi:hypothetical protein